MVVVHRSVNETKTEHADNELMPSIDQHIQITVLKFFIAEVAKAVLAEN